MFGPQEYPGLSRECPLLGAVLGNSKSICIPFKLKSRLLFRHLERKTLLSSLYSNLIEYLKLFLRLRLRRRRRTAAKKTHRMILGTVATMIRSLTWSDFVVTVAGCPVYLSPPSVVGDSPVSVEKLPPSVLGNSLVCVGIPVTPNKLCFRLVTREAWKKVRQWFEEKIWISKASTVQLPLKIEFHTS